MTITYPRNIYEVYAKVVDANGACNTLSGYPKIFDSRTYDNDSKKAYQRALGEYHEVYGAMCKRDDRQLQLVMLIHVNSGMVMEYGVIGTMADVIVTTEDPEPEETPEGEGE